MGIEMMKYNNFGCLCNLRVLWAAVGLLPLLLVACAQPQLIGLAYTHVRLPLTQNLDNTPVPDGQAPSSRIVEVREPFSGFGIYARMNTNAIGDIAISNGIDELYFADQEIFSILGIWKSLRVHVYGREGDGL
jgi:hypothetical protein